MTEIRYTQRFGSHMQGSVGDVPDTLARKLIRVGVAELASTPTTPVEPTVRYVADKVVRSRTVKKAKEPDVVQ